MPALSSSPATVPRRCAVLAAAALLLPPVLAGCGTAESAPEGADGHREDIGAAARARVVDGGTLRWAVDALPRTLNSYQPDATAVTDRVAQATLPALFTLDARGRPQPNDDYLQAAGVVDREPRQTVLYQLHPDARWSDGRPMGVADFVAQWKALRGRDPKFVTARNAGYDRIARIEPGAGAHQVKVVFRQPYADWQALFTPLYPRSVTADATTFNEGLRDRLPVAGGPFAVTRLDRRAGTLTLERNPRWWGDRAKLDRIVLTALDDRQRRRALAEGRVDLAPVTVAEARALDGDPADTRRIRGRAPAAAPPLPKPQGYEVRRALGAAHTQLTLNGEDGPLADERVRLAVARALDREVLARRALAPAGLPAEPLGSHLHLPGQHGYRDTSKALGGPDVESAQALLADAGWRSWDARDHRGGTSATAAAARAAGDRGTVRVRTRGGQPLRLRLLVPGGPGGELARDTGRRIAAMLRQIGAQTEVRAVRDAEEFTERLAQGKFDLALYSWPATAFPATDARPLYAKPRVGAGGVVQVGQNYSRVGTDHVNQLFERAMSELDEAARSELMRRADAHIWTVAGSIPLYQRPELVAVRGTVANAGAFGLRTPRFQDIGFLQG